MAQKGAAMNMIIGGICGIFGACLAMFMLLQLGLTPSPLTSMLMGAAGALAGMYIGATHD